MFHFHTWQLQQADHGVVQRICPGMHIAEHTMVRRILLYMPLYLMVLQELTTMRLLWAFDFRPEIDQVTGQPIEVNIEDYSSVSPSPCLFEQRV